MLRSNGNPAQRAFVTMTNRHTGELVTIDPKVCYTDRQGRVTLKAPPGGYVVAVLYKSAREQFKVAVKPEMKTKELHLAERPD